MPSTTNSYVGICALAQGGSERHVTAADKSFGQRGGLGVGPPNNGQFVLVHIGDECGLASPMLWIALIISIRNRQADIIHNNFLLTTSYNIQA